MAKTSKRDALPTALQARWAQPDADAQRRLGEALWTDFLASTVGEAAPEALIGPIVTRVVSEGVAREFWARLSRQSVESEILRLKSSGGTLFDLVGEEGADALRRETQRAREPNRELMARILDQPLLRQALKETLQSGLQQFLSQLGEMTFGKSEVGPTGGGMARGIMGEVGRGFGRGLARRVKETAAIGKTWAEGMGVGRAFEDQIQPFLASYASKAVSGLTENLMSGERSELAAEARLNILETLLETPLDELLPEPDLSRINLRMQLVEAIAGHLAAEVVDHGHVEDSVKAFLGGIEGETFGALFARLAVDPEPEEGLLIALGEIGHRALSRPALTAWLAGEIEEVSRA